MSSQHPVLSFSSATIRSSGGGVARRYSFLSAIASSFALPTEDRPATADPTERGPPVLTAQNFRLDNPEMKADQEARSLPAGPSGRNHAPTNANRTMIIER